ncbi:hypothetical protein KAR91_33300 [Candidatus Pacearchaeota archaeon]|nr:hypothetical protein [Candidatus Pacearchaeota archaeon]
MEECINKKCVYYEKNKANPNGCLTEIDIKICPNNLIAKEAPLSVPFNGVLWRAIDTAPKDMTEILGWREDAGVMLIRYIAPIDFLTESELEEIGEESAEAEDWFFADFIAGGRLEGSEAPTHWMPLPDAP